MKIAVQNFEEFHQLRAFRLAILKTLMVKEFSPAMSRIGINLLHRRDSTNREESFNEIVRKTETILNAGERLKDLPAPINYMRDIQQVLWQSMRKL